MQGMETIKAQDIKWGDRFEHNGSGWTAQADAVTKGDEVHVDVRYNPDGGHDVRIWAKDHEIPFITTKASRFEA